METAMATKDDIEALTQMRLRYLREDGGPLSPSDEAEIARALPGYFEEHLGKDLFAYTARSEGAIVCVAMLHTTQKPMSPSFINGRCASVLNVYTLPRFRRRGYARRVMEALLRGAADMGIASVELKATRAGIPLYRSLGFRESAGRYTLMRWETAEGLGGKEETP